MLEIHQYNNNICKLFHDVQKIWWHHFMASNYSKLQERGHKAPQMHCLPSNKLFFRYTVGCIDVFTVEHESKLPLLFRLYYPSSDKCDSSRKTNKKIL